MEERERETIIERIITSTALNDIDTIKKALLEAYPVEIAQAIRYLEPEEQEKIISLLPVEESSEVLLALRDIDEGAAIKLTEELDIDNLSEMVSVMEPDDAADVLADLPKSDAAEVLDLMEDEESKDIQELLKYPEETAGGIMTLELVAMPEDSTVDDVLRYIRENPPNRQIFYVYVIDKEGKFVGAVPIDKLITEIPERILGDMAIRDIISVTPDADREEVAELVTQYDMVALPVVDKQDKLIGVITADDVMETIKDEATEDIYKLAGTSDDELSSNSAFRIAQLRLPWIFVSLAGSVISALMIRLFSGSMLQAISIASFIPAIMAMGGNTGLQSSIATVRGLSIGYISLSYSANIIFKELRTALIMGAVCGVIISCVASVWMGKNLIFGAVVGLSIFLAMSLSAVLGVLIPIIFKKIKVDPAIASGPLITMINDITGLAVYLSLATFLLHRIIGK